MVQDTRSGVENHTLIVSNGGREMGDDKFRITDGIYSDHLIDGGRTWLIDNVTSYLEEIHIVQSGHMALHPSLTVDRYSCLYALSSGSIVI